MFPKSLRPLLPYVKRYRWAYLVGTACVFLHNGIWVLFPLVLGKASDDLNKGVTQHKLLIYAGLLLAIAVSKGIFQFVTRWVVIGVSRDIEFDLRNDLFARLESLSYSYYQRHRTGDIMARATNDLNAGIANNDRGAILKAQQEQAQADLAFEQASTKIADDKKVMMDAIKNMLA